MSLIVILIVVGHIVIAVLKVLSLSYKRFNLIKYIEKKLF
jgi:hypothetical protein